MSRLLPCLFVLVVAGCAFHPPDVGEKVDPIPEADSPQNLVVRFERVYEQQSLVLYEPLLTSDFRYTFSAASDPTLVAQYGNNWGKDDETETTKHLFEGFTNSAGDPVPAASKIDMTLSGVQYGPDPFHADSAGYYQKVVLSSVVMEIDVPASPDQIVYNISARHEFYIVRGDVAALDAGQEARPDRWYIRRWDDLSTPTGARTPPRNDRLTLGAGTSSRHAV